LGIRWNVQSCRCLSQWKIRDALPRPGRFRHSRLGYAESTDGIHFTRPREPVLSPETDYEKMAVSKIRACRKSGDTYYLTYTGYNKKDAQLCLATSRDLIHWERKGVILPAYREIGNVAWTKSGAIVPEKIDGKYWMYWLGTAADKTDQMGLFLLQRSPSLDRGHTTPVLPRRAGKLIPRRRARPPADPDERGIVLIYNGADDGLVYRTAVAVSTATIRANCSPAPMPLSSPRKREGRKSARCPTLSSWGNGEARHRFCSTTVVPTNTSE